MHVIVVGCGRVGSTVAMSLDEAGHDVVVIDRRSTAFSRLSSDFGGRTMVGVGFDRQVLVDAGIGPESAVAAVTNGDNSNILIARVAREMFGAERVVARIYDTKRANVYERLGIPTVAAVSWTSRRVLQVLLPSTILDGWVDPTASHVLTERRVSDVAAGRSIADLEALGARVCLVTRHGTAEVPDVTKVLQEGDIVHLMTSVDLDLSHEHGGKDWFR